MKKQLKSNLPFIIILMFCSCSGAGKDNSELSDADNSLNLDLKEVLERDKEGKTVVKYYIDSDSIIQGDVEYYYNNGLLRRKEFYVDGVIAGWATEYNDEGKVKSQIAYRYIKKLNKFDLNEVRFFDENQNIDINKSIEVRLIEEKKDSFQYGVLPFQTDSIHCFLFSNQFLIKDYLFEIGNTILIEKKHSDKIALFKIFQSDGSKVISHFPVYKLIGDAANTTLRLPAQLPQ